MKQAISIAIAGFFLFPASAWAQNRTESGRQTVATWCAPCHASPARTASSDLAPPLDGIAESRSRGSIAAFLARPHGRMPDIALSREQIEDVLSYMETLKKR